MPEGRAIIESSDFNGVIEVLETLQRQYRNFSATIPAETADGRYISSVYYSNETTIMEIHK